MADKCKPLKIESSSTGGTQNDMFPTEANPASDYLAAKGIAFENSDTRLLDLNGSGELSATDSFFTTSTALVDILPAYSYVTASAETNTTSLTTYSTKVTLGPITLRAGTYRIAWSTKWRCLAANREIDIRVRDGATTLHESRHSYLRTAGSPQLAGFTVLAGISGSKTFTLEWKVGGTATTAYVSDSWLEIQRVVKT
jgi:hypothetical protein